MEWTEKHYPILPLQNIRVPKNEKVSLKDG